MNKWNLFTLLYLCLGLGILAVELTGVFTHFRSFDTISQTFWWWREKMPWISRVVMASFLIWLGYHFLIYKGRVMD